MSRGNHGRFFIKSGTPRSSENSLSVSEKTPEISNKTLSAILSGLELYGENENDAASNKYRTTASPYDIVVRINNLLDLRTHGWEILLGQHTKSIKSTTKGTGENGASVINEQKEGVVVSVLGAYNRGKSFLLNQLCNVSLPTGTLVHTEGISITAGRQNYTNIVFLDTAGTDTPVRNDEIEYKRAREALLREVVLHLSTFIIIVVNRLRTTDQIYINQILKYYRNSPHKKTIIIVHNLLDVEKIPDVDKIISEEIQWIFGAVQQKTQLSINGCMKDIIYFTSKQFGGTDIRHYILGRSGSEADKLWNMQTIDGIMNFLQNTDNKRNLDLINDMITFINHKLSKLFVQNSTEQTPNLQLVQHNSKPFIVLSNRRDYEDLSQRPYELKLSEQLIYDDAGYFIRNESEYWQPRYNLYEDETKYLLVLELPGFEKGVLKPRISGNSITIENIRRDLNTSMNNPIIHQSDIPTGSFKLNISFQQAIEERFTAERNEGFINLTILKKRSTEYTEPV
ncbi:unnamed protein product [Adineta ricciae]|uniref:SHSP domain-containing protein n=1 Tax=Adineta ricciae TaxID=249248 RepID=A0A813RF67_ADIRI|nr:unnamed protein product [Adineta ricciae]CAF1276967.1 unnamed protein product [Adineta ricciae]